MRRMLALIGCLCFAQAGAQTWRDLLLPSEEQLTQSCVTATRVEALPRISKAQKRTYLDQAGAASAGKFLNDFRSLTDDFLAQLQALVNSVEIQFPSGSAYVICEKAADKPKPQPSAQELPTTLLIYVNSTAEERAETESYTAVLAFYDENGQELARLQPFRARRGEIPDWSFSCLIGPCEWRGKNTYYFALSPALENSLEQVSTFKVIFTRGQGVEERQYKLEDFKKSSISDHED